MWWLRETGIKKRECGGADGIDRHARVSFFCSGVCVLDPVLDTYIGVIGDTAVYNCRRRGPDDSHTGRCASECRVSYFITLT